MTIDDLDKLIRNLIIGDLSEQGFAPEQITSDLLDAFMPQYIAGLIVTNQGVVNDAQQRAKTALTAEWQAALQRIIPMYQKRVSDLQGLQKRYP